jgi:hypothetical protein
MGFAAEAFKENLDGTLSIDFLEYQKIHLQPKTGIGIREDQIST